MNRDDLQRDGMMMIVSSPSGAGKTTLTRALLQKHTDIKLSVSVTTRPARENESDGIDYYFVDEETFHQMVGNDEFLEYAKVFNHYYGTPRQAVEQALKAGEDVLFDIDWNGTQQIKQNTDNQIVTIFILPPDAESLSERLKTRALDSADTISYRMREAENEISHYHEYDYIIINDDKNRAMSQIEDILVAERAKRIRYPKIDHFVKDICNGIRDKHS